MKNSNNRLFNICTFIFYVFIFISAIFSFVELIIEFNYWAFLLIALVIFSIYYYFKYKERQKNIVEERNKSNLIDLIDFSNTINDLNYSNFKIIKAIKLDYLRINIALKNNIAFEYKYNIKNENRINFFNVDFNLLDNLLSNYDWNNVSNMEHYFLNMKLNDYINTNIENIIKK